MALADPDAKPPLMHYASCSGTAEDLALTRCDATSVWVMRESMKRQRHWGVFAEDGPLFALVEMSLLHSCTSFF